MISDETRNALIKDSVDDIRKHISGGYLFGVKIDMDNADEVIYAAYLYGYFKEDEFNRGINKVSELFREPT